MTASGNVVSMVTPSCRALHSMTSRSTLVAMQPSRSNLFSVARPLNIICAAAPSALEKAEEVEDTAVSKESMPSFTPNSFEVQSLLMEVCDETSIAELELKVGEFKLHVKRDLGKLKGPAPPVAVAPPIPSKPMVESGAVAIPPPTTTSLSVPAITIAAILDSPASKTGSRFGLLEAAADEGLHFVTSPKVGLFRKSRVVKGKSGRPLCEEGQIVKDGQVVCYVEQLGTQQPVEAENSGEVMKILCKDGEPVGYGDPLIAIRPSFPGIK